MIRMRRLLAVSLLVAAATTACGKGGSNQALTHLDQVGFVSQAAAESVSQKTAKIAMTETVTPPGGSGTGSIQIIANGAVDFARKIFEFKADFPAALGISGSMEMIMAGQTVYMQLPAAIRTQAGLAKPWLGMKVDKLSGSPLGTSNFADPSSTLEALRSVASSVTKVGTETIRGVKTTRYAVTLDLTKIAAKVPAAQRAAVSSLKFDHMDVYVSDDSLVRRESFTISAAGASVTANVDFYDYGRPVDVSVPPNSQVEFKSLQDLISGK
jgi:hypothetical protein